MIDVLRELTEQALLTSRQPLRKQQIQKCDMQPCFEGPILLCFQFEGRLMKLTNKPTVAAKESSSIS